ncbi:MAG: hypothetical protein ACOYBY_02005 [Dermatophilaceae bacterium]
MGARAAGVAVSLAVAAAALAGCTDTGAAQSPSSSLSWTLLALPGDAAAVTLTAYRDEVLVGTRSPGADGAPGLVRVTGSAAAGLPVAAASGYSHEARWQSIAVDDNGGLLAIGGARGGAHANVRWTVWQGTADSGLHEQEQTFETFGGWGAGDLLDAVAAPAGPAVVGSWGSAQVGLDAAVWLPRGGTWVRQDSAGTALESTPDALVGPLAASADGPRILIAGSLVSLGTGSVQQLPAVWRSDGHATQWSRVLLPDAGASGQATGAVCRQQTCTVVGRADDRLAVWRLGASAERLSGVPDALVTDASPATAPAPIDDGVVIGVSTASGSTVLREQAGTWTSAPGPPGPVRALAVVGSVEYAVAADSSGTDRLWSRPA